MADEGLPRRPTLMDDDAPRCTKATRIYCAYIRAIANSLHLALMSEDALKEFSNWWHAPPAVVTRCLRDK
jgi:hypothetical protein